MEVESKLQAADYAIEQAFFAVSSAERTGANVTHLINELSNLSGRLAQARNAERSGDYNAAFEGAEYVQLSVQRIVIIAQTMVENSSPSMVGLYLIIGTALAESLVFLAFLYLIWALFKKRLKLAKQLR